MRDGRRSLARAILGLLIVLPLLTAMVAFVPVFTCLLCSNYGPYEGDCPNCGGDGRSSLYVNWRFASWVTGRWLVRPF